MSLIANADIWLLCAIIVVLLSRSSVDALVRHVTSTRVLLALLAVAMLSVAVRVVTGYLAPGDFTQEVVGARALRSTGTVFPYPFRPELEAWLTTDAPSLLDRLPGSMQQWARGQRAALAALYVTQAHPPFLVLTIAPLVYLLGGSTAFLATTAASVAAIAWCAHRLAARWENGPRGRFLLLLAVLLTWQPVLAAIRHGQVSIVIGALCLAAWLWLRSGREIQAGVALALATALKIYPAALLVYVAWRSRRAATAAALTLVAAILVTLTFTSIADARAFLTSARLVTDTYGVAVNNMSITSMLTRVAGSAAASAGWLLCIVFGLVALLVGRRRDGEMVRDAEFGMVSCLALLLSPVTWSHYFVMLIQPGFVLSRAAAAGSLTYPVLVPLAFLALSIPDQPLWWMHQRAQTGSSMWEVASVLPTLSLMGLSMLLFSMIVHERDRPRPMRFERGRPGRAVSARDPAQEIGRGVPSIGVITRSVRSEDIP